MPLSESRRNFLLNSLKISGYVALGPSMMQMSALANGSLASILQSYGPLQGPDINGVRLPVGFTSRIVAVTGERVTNSDYEWHRSPDGGACFPTSSGGWIYTSNCEEAFWGGGVGAIEFNANGDIINARQILRGTNVNCAGGATPWNTWLSCEEIDRGIVWETDPYGQQDPRSRRALGAFKHEAAAVDPANEHIYLTEDESDGCLYRFTPRNGFPDISEGDLEVAVVNDLGQVDWVLLDDPTPGFFSRRTRHQISDAKHFDGGEGIWYHEGFVYFTTKGDNRVWVLDTMTQTLDILYDKDTSSNPILSGVDNVTVSALGDVLVAEDGGDMQIVVLDSAGNPTPLLQIENQDESEITGPAFNPQGNRLYFSSQRGKSRFFRQGITYEVTGPFQG
ncbi:MAG: alkaline phosphatase PhoX [Pseudomonadota bacterium]